MAEDFLQELNRRMRKGWTAHVSEEGRLYYMNHETKISSWLPPVESWECGGGTGLPYGWEAAIDKEGKTYYINHGNRTTSRESPRRGDRGEDPTPREVTLVRDPRLGFGFVAGSERPVIVRFVTEGGPNEHQLLPDDQIMRINGEDVSSAPREQVIEMIRSCKEKVHLLVCQPQTNNSTRKSALLTAAKKAKLKDKPSRVRFSEGVTINGSPLYSPSPVDGQIPFLPNVLKVFLENGQTKSFKYDSTTTVQDVLNSLFEKLSIRCVRHFCLATEHVKITRRNRLTLLHPQDTLAKIASKPGAHHLRCVLRVAFVPKDARDLLQNDPIAFEYLYMQCCQDVVEERLVPEPKYELVLRLAALHMHCLTLPSKRTLKSVERECGGLERFVPASLLGSMRAKELRKLLSHFLKQHPPLSPQQAKLRFLDALAQLPAYGAKCFATNTTDSNPETTILLSPRFGISQISCLRSTSPVTISRLEDVSGVKVIKEDEYSCLVEISSKEVGKQVLQLSMEERDAEEFVLLLRGYHLLSGEEVELRVERDAPTWQAETVPIFHSRHLVRESPWSYPPPPSKNGVRTLDLAVHPPPYVPVELKRTEKVRSVSVPLAPSFPSPTPAGGKERSISLSHPPPPPPACEERHPGVDYRTLLQMELLAEDDVDVDVHEARNDQLIRRLADVERILEETAGYGSKFQDTLVRNGKHDAFRTTEQEDEECSLKPADSLLLLSESRPPFKERPLADEDDPLSSDTDHHSPSPLRRASPLRSSLNQAPPMLMRRDSSFGLHSPDLPLPSGEAILDVLKQLQAEELLEGDEELLLCLDPDLIDLTLIPPPATPQGEEGEFQQGGGVDPPDAFVGNIHLPGGEVVQEVFETDLLGGCCGDTLDSRVVSSIDSLIASLTVPPPPPRSSSEQQPPPLSALIVPPPPPSPDAVLARLALFDADQLDSVSSSSSSGYDTLPCDSPPSSTLLLLGEEEPSWATLLLQEEQETPLTRNHLRRSFRTPGRAPRTVDGAAPLHQAALKDAAATVARLRHTAPSAEHGDVAPLAAESRRFVTCSKLFVKAAVEGGATAPEAAGACAALLTRMAALPAPAAPLERLREVALAFLRTLEAAQTPEALMKRAAELASALTALMRTLRDMC